MASSKHQKQSLCFYNLKVFASTLRSMDLKAEHGFDGPITRARAKKMVNEAQTETEMQLRDEMN